MGIASFRNVKGRGLGSIYKTYYEELFDKSHIIAKVQ